MDKSISYYAHEESMARMERSNVRLWALSIILMIILLLTNGAWVVYECQYEDIAETTTITQNADTNGGGNACINDGVHFNGESKSDNN